MSGQECQTLPQGPREMAKASEAVGYSDDHYDRLCQLIRRLSDPAGLSMETRWKLAARGVSIEVLRQCLDIIPEAPDSVWPARRPTF